MIALKQLRGLPSLTRLVWPRQRASGAGRADAFTYFRLAALSPCFKNLHIIPERL